MLRDAGFSVVDLGGDTPAEAFGDAARILDCLVAMAVGSTLSGNELAVAAVTEAVHRANPAIPVIVGGAGVPSQAAARRIGADQWSSADGRTVVRLATGETA
jgi:methanogenic corrinoid protein MtbC1